jgi:hypothetical protein
VKSARFLFLLMCFFTDVKVRAADCSNTPCVMHTSSSSQHKIFSEGKRRLVLAPESLLQVQKDGLRLVKGLLYIEADERIRLTAPFGFFVCGGGCRALIERQMDSVKLKSLKGNWRIWRLGDKEVYGLPPGMEITLGRVEIGGTAEMEFPQSLPWQSTLQSWSRLFPGSPEQFKQIVTEFRPVWRSAVEAAANLQLRAAGRTIASHEAELARGRARQRARAIEDESLRKLFRERNYIDP